MDKNFWLERWQKNDIGFHKEEPHHFLLRFFDCLKVNPGDSFFVPLCGKSPDLKWLQAKGLEVVGVELSRQAIADFVRENKLQGCWSNAAANMLCWAGPGYRLYCGDFFRLRADALGGSKAAYDRGSLVALPADMRIRYVKQLAALLPSDSKVLIVSYEYDQSETYGPPFSVPFNEIEDLFAADFKIELLVEEDTLRSHQGLAARGVTRLSEFAVLLSRY